VASISWHDFRLKASQDPQRIVLADGEDPRVVRAAAQTVKDRIAEPVLIGSPSVIQAVWREASGPGTPACQDPENLPPSVAEALLKEFLGLPKFKNLSPAEARLRIKDPLWLGALYLKCGSAAGFVGGAARTTADTLRAVFRTIGLTRRISTLFGFFLIEPRGAPGDPKPLVLLADCAVIPEPSSKQLASIGVGAAEAYHFFTAQTPKTVFLSFSTHGSAEYPSVDRMREAAALAAQKAPQLSFEGEWQADAALDLFCARLKGVGNSPLAGQANVLIVPNLDCGNIAYKLIQRLGGCRCVGPVLWGTALPANDLSRGCSEEDVVDMIALTALQAQAGRNAELPERTIPSSSR